MPDVMPPPAPPATARSGGVIVLVGLMGSGKSSVGLRLAQQLKCSFIDNDAQICHDINKTVEDIFAADGEEEFRRIESTVLWRVLDESCLQVAQQSAQFVVIATGGGAVLSSINRDKIATQADHVIWLQADVDALVERTASSKIVRPLLESDPRNSLTALIRGRSSLYQQIATLQIDTTGLEIDQVVDVIANVVKPNETK